MKIIQSFWSGNQNDINFSYGWNSPRYHWMSWILSCHQLVKYYDEVELYTDDFGYEILINQLQLPYTRVHVVLNELKIYPKDLWAIAKIKVYSLQEEPFIHIDGDVFIWDKFPDSLTKSNLIAQNLENTTGYYREMWNEIFPYLTYVPNEMLSFHNGMTNSCCNMGIIGGNEIVFFKKYCKKAFEFINRNSEVWNKINLFNFNIFFEQEFFYELTSSNSKKITYLFEGIWDDNGYIGFGDFNLIPHKRTYLHLLGSFKRQASVCKNLEIYLMKYYPDSYSRLSKLINTSNKENKFIDFLTANKVEELIKEFEKEIRNNNVKPQNYLLKRDLFNQGLSAKLEVFFVDKIDFEIFLHSDLITLDDMESNLGIQKALKIKEINCIPINYELDEIDLIIYKELLRPIKYSVFIKKMNCYLDDENKESEQELKILLNRRLINYVDLKIISIYN